MLVQTTLVAHQVVELFLASQLFLLRVVERCWLLFELLLALTVRDRLRNSLLRNRAQIG